MEYLGKLHETVVKFPQTDIWMDSCGAEELDFGMQRGISGATSNPVIIGGVINKELPECEKRICRLIENPDLAEQLGRKARDICKIANGKAVFEQWQDYIESVCK